jgi:acyl carrier protein
MGQPFDSSSLATRNRLVQTIRSVFPEWSVPEAGEITSVRLMDVPGWDSMNAVTFQMELEDAFGVDFSEEPAKGRDNIGDIIKRLASAPKKG